MGISPHENVFGVDYSDDGRKYFLRGNRIQYVRAYDRALEHKRAHWYEILLKDRPCALILDIESSSKHYTSVLASIHELLKIFSVAVEGKTGQHDEFYYLDSSNEKKVSFHIVGSVFFRNLVNVSSMYVIMSKAAALYM